ncbi:putative phosphoserine aminotransferase [Phaeomoniella chlamydospora]|uniref:phosphoserine transaminase n=1 Tax=Phaeomoniella chlamydospora TaxID=158046 RepID=A0A0G2ENM6_PHACM|nr:putative phosphoserine aminotransferase [Phaeomoniella chlamydospora]
MPTREEIAYFGAGPAPLPTSVIEAGGQAFVNFKDTGLGLAEISHRSPTANAILAETKEALAKLYDIPDNYEILFMQAGGTGEFSAVVHNLVGVWIERRRQKAIKELEAAANSGAEPADQAQMEEWLVPRLKREIEEELKLDYIVTGSWSLKASQEASRLVGDKHVNVAINAKKANGGKFGSIPPESEWSLTPTKKEGGTGSAFVYYCDNETVDGVEFPSFPKSLEPQGVDEEDERIVVADMSSNFLSRKTDVKKYGVIFGGAQKNVGVTGITIVIIRKDLLPPHTQTPPASLLHKLGLSAVPGPIMLDWPTIASSNSLYNTLPIFNLWIAGQVMIRLVNTYGTKGLSGQEEIADTKSKLIYNALDAHPDVYQVVPDLSVRSRMNICFRVKGGNADAEKAFLAGAEKRNLTGLKGHRSVGGIRASNYNAVPLENADKLARYLQEYAKGNQ